MSNYRILSVTAECKECGWIREAWQEQGLVRSLGKTHYELTGHTVQVLKTLEIIFCKVTPAPRTEDAE